MGDKASDVLLPLLLQVLMMLMLSGEPAFRFSVRVKIVPQLILLLVCLYLTVYSFSFIRNHLSLQIFR